ncbi:MULTISPECIES: hypothetical protein [Micromonosporaceae]|nr:MULTISPECIES: hypothetical protein [Micromonosporaceae]MDG4773954.1 hypothetical protein [Solwaraspora sp. WMMD792]ROO52372.1 hypothetical protein EDC02_7294 [Micromonospora sp. Llam0]WBB96954.1 hypothetical protein O7553_27425 [Solwaraspora sp. WMMA2059]WBC19142.1 hypothetical protein O7543_19945 [Solwaraspora sp. WMMA2080]WFE22684.1 hypothetical protein O7621_04885 [Solwaraspora sp. WMMD937]
MSMIDRIRRHREASRRTRALERALRSTDSAAVRDEIRAIAQRYHS